MRRTSAPSPWSSAARKNRSSVARRKSGMLKAGWLSRGRRFSHSRAAWTARHPVSIAKDTLGTTKEGQEKRGRPPIRNT